MGKGATGPVHALPLFHFFLRLVVADFLITRLRTHPSSRLQAQKAAEQVVKLAPIRLDIEYNGVKIRDQFTWNVNG